MKPLVFALIFIALAACGQETAVAPTEAIIPTAPTSTLIPITVTPSLLPISPTNVFIIPNPIQVEKWNEYEDALATAFFKSYLQPDEVVCEWVILGQSDREVYVWAQCASIYSAGPSQSSSPTVIHIKTDESVQSAEIPGAGTAYAPDIRRMFPSYVQEIIFNSPVLFSEEQIDHLRWRRGHPDTPPWVVLSSLPTQPTSTVMPMITPSTIQLERWPAYQTALATQFSYLPPVQVICEWEILGRAGNEIYVWAVCGEIGGNRVGLEGLAVIYVGGDIPNALRSDDPAMYPSTVLERYFSGSIHFQELVDHLRERQKHLFAEPPLVILNARAIP